MKLFFNTVKQKHLKEYLDSFMNFKIYSYYEIYINKKFSSKKGMHFIAPPLPLDANLFNDMINNFTIHMNPDLDEESIYWFYINTYINDIDSSKKDKILKYYEEYKEILDSENVVDIVLQYLMSAEAYRYVIKFLQSDNRITLKDIEDKLISIDELKGKDNYAFFIFTGHITKLLKNIQDDYKLKYENNKKVITKEISIEDKIEEISKKLEVQNFDNNIFNTEMIINNSYIDVDKQNEKLNNILEKIDLNLDNLNTFLTENKDINHSEYLNKFQKGLEGGLLLLSQLHVLKDKYFSKKNRIKEYILHKQNITQDLEILVALDNMVDNNAHDMLIVMAVISHELTLTDQESFELLQLLGFYKNESFNYKKGKFNQKFRTIKEHIYYNYKLLR